MKTKFIVAFFVSLSIFSCAKESDSSTQNVQNANGPQTATPAETQTLQPEINEVQTDSLKNIDIVESLHNEAECPVLDGQYVAIEKDGKPTDSSKLVLPQIITTKINEVGTKYLLIENLMYDGSYVNGKYSISGKEYIYKVINMNKEVGVCLKNTILFSHEDNYSVDKYRFYLNENKNLVSEYVKIPRNKKDLVENGKTISKVSTSLIEEPNYK